MKENNKKDIHKNTDTDVIIKNLMSTKENAMDGNFINDIGNGSFSNINTTKYGEEVDVDDL